MYERAELRVKLITLALRAALQEQERTRMREAFLFYLKSLAARAQKDHQYAVAYEARILRLEAACQPNICRWCGELGVTVTSVRQHDELAKTPVM